MNDQKKRERALDRFRTGWLTLVTGIALFEAGVTTWWTGHGFWPSSVAIAAGIINMALGGYRAIRYLTVRKDERAMNRLVARDLDERLVMIRSRAAGRAYWVSQMLVLCGLSWALGASEIWPTYAWPVTQWLWGAALLVPVAVFTISVQIESRAV